MQHYLHLKCQAVQHILNTACLPLPQSPLSPLESGASQPLRGLLQMAHSPPLAANGVELYLLNCNREDIEAIFVLSVDYLHFLGPL